MRAVVDVKLFETIPIIGPATFLVRLADQAHT